MLQVERLLWVAIVLYCLQGLALNSLVPILTFVHLVSIQRNGSGDRHGCFMSIGLLPCVLLPDHSSYSLVITFLALWEWDRHPISMAYIVFTSYSILSFCRGEFPRMDLLEWNILVVFFSIWFWMGRLGMSASFTRGEFFCVRGLATVAVTEFLLQQQTVSIYAPTAVTGVVGCVLSCGLVGAIRSANNLFWRLFGITIGALGTVETMFWVRGIDQYDFPRCLNWIFFDFLMTTEPSAVNERWDFLPKVPRIAWLGYWSIIMLVTIPLAPGSDVTPVLARKWFHFVAILLFVPSTLLAPEMQSLSYAVALCVLMIFETTRRNVPWLNAFYKTYLDASKQENDEDIIISHMALIVGCATPLWLWQWRGSSADERLVALWGVWVLGAGDSMAAIVGKRFGRHRWGNQKRTVEGSLAMLIVLSVLAYSQPSANIITAITFTTMLEAFTLQIDNIVLPVAGYAILVSQ